MTSYFKAAERCGLRANTEGFKRTAHRSLACSTPAQLRAETAALAARESLAVVAAIGARPPPTGTIEVEDALLPYSESRADHLRRLQESADDIAIREGKDLSDYQQEQKVQAQLEDELRRALESEREADEQRRRDDAAREAATRQSQEDTRQKLRDAYGPCFLWNEAPPTDGEARRCAPAGNRRLQDAIEASVEQSMRSMPWLTSNDTAEIVS